MGDVVVGVPTHAGDLFAFLSVPDVAAAHQRAVEADLSDEAQVRAEPFIDLRVADCEIPLTVAKFVEGAQRVAGWRRIGEIQRQWVLGIAAQQLCRYRMRAFLVAAVHADHVVGVVIAMAKRADDAQRGVLIDVVTVARDRDIGRLVQHAEPGTQHARHQQQGGGVLRDEGAVGAIAIASGHANAPGRIGDLPRVEHVELRAEIVGAFQEKGALLREEQGKAVVEVQLRLVGFDLRKIGIDRAVQRQVRRRRPGHIHARFDVDAVIQPRATGFVAVFRAGDGDGRHDVEVAARAHARHALELFEGAQQTLGIPADLLVEQLVARAARVAAVQAHGPALGLVAFAEAQGGERNAHLHVVASLGDSAGAGPQSVPGIVLVAGGLVVDQVHLHAQGIDEEFVSAALVVEGVDEDADEVVAVCGIAVAQARADVTGLRVVGTE